MENKFKMLSAIAVFACFVSSKPVEHIADDSVSTKLNQIPSIDYLSLNYKNTILYSFKNDKKINNEQVGQQNQSIIDQEQLPSFCNETVVNPSLLNESINQFLNSFLKHKFLDEFKTQAESINIQNKLYGYLINLWFHDSFGEPALKKSFCGVGSKNWIITITNNNYVVQNEFNHTDANTNELYEFSAHLQFVIHTMCQILSNKQNVFESKLFYRCQFKMFPSVVFITVITKLNENNKTILYTKEQKLSEIDFKFWNKKIPLPKQKLQELINAMWNADKDRLPESAIKLNWGLPINDTNITKFTNHTLITYLNETIFERPLYQALIDLQNNNFFNPNVCVTEYNYTHDRLEKINKFLDQIFDTDVFKLAYEFLKNENKADTNFTAFREKLFNFWFDTYSRCHHILGSSGFEHVFCGEYRDDIVDGHHNWINYYLAQKRGEINYHGYYTYREKILGTFQYTLNGYIKKKGGFFFRTSPAFDFTLFTVCYLMNRESHINCQFHIKEDKFWVTTHTETCKTGNCIGTTYPGTDM